MKLMKLFAVYRKLLPILIGFEKLERFGFCPSSSLQKYLYRFTSLMGYFVFVAGLILAAGFLAYQAETAQEYAENTNMLITLLCDTFYIFSLRWRFKTCLQLIELCASIIEERECKKLSNLFQYRVLLQSNLFTI